jgi:hypothetical protein
MTDEALTRLLAERVMKWTATPDRFIQAQRKWTPRWRFQPCAIFEHAVHLLDAAEPSTYSLIADETRCFWARVNIDGAVGECRDRSRARAITIAVARAVGIEIDEVA